FGPKAFEAGRRFDQRAVDAEVLVAEQVQAIRLLHHRVKELATDAVPQQPLSVLGKGAVVEARLEHVHIQKPSKQQVIGQLLTEGAFAAHRVQTDQQAGFEQALRRNRRPTFTVSGVHLVEQGRQLQQCGIRVALDSPQRMVYRYQRLRIDERQ